jgi:hypothetical protein
VAEWLYEDGIGENRAILIEDGDIVAAEVERDGDLRVGTIAEARLVEADPRSGGVVRFADDREAILARVPAGISIGADLVVEIVREAMPEPGKVKRAVARASDAAPRPAPSLYDRLAASGMPVVRSHAHDAHDRFAQAGWGELLDEAASGEIVFPGGALRISLTPAMTLIDIDGAPGDAYALALAGITAAGRAIVRMDITGSIGIDLPTVADRAQRLALADALDAIVPQPFERTAVNGFGFLQLVRRRMRPSLAERMRYRPIEAAALALLRRAERSHGNGPARLVAAPPVAARLEARPALVERLAQRLGRGVVIAAAQDEGVDGGYVE